jgi:malonate transporter
MGIYPILAQAYGQEDFSAAALLVATVMSFFTLSALLWVLRSAPI